jgi:hypothetical protein
LVSVFDQRFICVDSARARERGTFVDGVEEEREELVGVLLAAGGAGQLLDDRREVRLGREGHQLRVGLLLQLERLRESHPTHEEFNHRPTTR